MSSYDSAITQHIYQDITVGSRADRKAWISLGATEQSKIMHDLPVRVAPFSQSEIRIISRCARETRKLFIAEWAQWIIGDQYMPLANPENYAQYARLALANNPPFTPSAAIISAAPLDLALELQKTGRLAGVYFGAEIPTKPDPITLRYLPHVSYVGEMTAGIMSPVLIGPFVSVSEYARVNPMSPHHQIYTTTNNLFCPVAIKRLNKLLADQGSPQIQLIPQEYYRFGRDRHNVMCFVRCNHRAALDELYAEHYDVQTPVSKAHCLILSHRQNEIVDRLLADPAKPAILGSLKNVLANTCIFLEDAGVEPLTDENIRRLLHEMTDKNVYKCAASCWRIRCVRAGMLAVQELERRGFPEGYEI